MTRVLVQCDGARIPPQVAQDYEDAHKLPLNLLGGGAANVTLRIQELSDPLNGSLQGQALDLVRTAAYVYAADQLVSRGGDTDIYGNNWRREFVVCLPVSDPGFWNQQLVQEQLQQVLGFASEDLWSFSFDESRLPEQLPLQIDERAIRHNPDSVVLFSGGADSLCAAIEANLVDGTKPVLISHHPSPVADHRQQNLVRELRRYLPGWFFPHTRFQVNRIKSRERDTTQRTRSFLFAALGSATASTLGLSRVVLADNGIVSLNLPINDQEIGAIASRSTHPKFIGFFNELAATVLPCQPQVSNPLWARTKAEALEVLRSAQAGPLLQETTSCAHRSRLPVVTPHCGVCSQCIERRFASAAAKLEEFDLAERYKADIFRGALEGNGLTMAESYIRFARKVHQMSVDGLFLEYPQLGDCILSDDPSPATAAEALGNLVLRNTTAVLDVLANELSRAAREAVTHTLPPTCLIQLSVERGLTGLPVPPVLAEVELTDKEEEEAKRRRFKGSLPIHITGKLEGRRSNVITIGAIEIILPDAEFRLLVRLVVALYETENGFVPRGNLSGGGLGDEGIYAPEAVEQAVNRLRFRLRPALQGLDPKKYIEVQRGQIRLSTHRKFAIVHRACLMQHPDKAIRCLVGRLPQD